MCYNVFDAHLSDAASSSPEFAGIREARETLREKGQFWTPDWVADAMVAYALQDFPGTLFDPAVGAGAFLRAGKRWAERHSHNLRLRGREIDPTALLQAEEAGLSHTDLQGVELRDFVLDPPEDYLPAIIANPPYMRHHRLPESVKQQLRHFSATILGRPLDGRGRIAGLFSVTNAATPRSGRKDGGIASRGCLRRRLRADALEMDSAKFPP